MSLIAQVVVKPKRVLSVEEAADYLGGAENLKRLQAAGWVSALGGKMRGRDYDIRALDVALDRVGLDGWPGKSISES
jgi:hypothetical protein